MRKSISIVLSHRVCGCYCSLRKLICWVTLGKSLPLSGPLCLPFCPTMQLPGPLLTGPDTSWPGTPAGPVRSVVDHSPGQAPAGSCWTCLPLQHTRLGSGDTGSTADLADLGQDIVTPWASVSSAVWRARAPALNVAGRQSVMDIVFILLMSFL